MGFTMLQKGIHVLMTELQLLFGLVRLDVITKPI